MGCDIHMYPEVKKDWGWSFVYRFHAPEGSFWSCRYPPRDRANYYALEDRWYWLFGQLAGVRRDGPPIAEPRGVPADADPEVKAEMENPDYHTKSWVTLAELEAHPWEERHDGTVPPAEIQDIRDWLKRLGELGPYHECIRIVFAFDN